jgi:hypothetical protein
LARFFLFNLTLAEDLVHVLQASHSLGVVVESEKEEAECMELERGRVHYFL